MSPWWRRESGPASGAAEDGADGLRLLAVDLETTGLEATRDAILAAGWVAVDGTDIVLGTARRTVVAAGSEVGQSATIHGLTDDEIAAGRPLGDVVEELLNALAGRILLAHHAPIEVGFLRVACRSLGRALPPFDVIDTMELEARHHERRGGDPPRGALRLWAARDRFGLPAYRAHDALMDAVSCAELYLAQVAELTGAGRTPGLRQLRTRQRSLRSR